MPVNPSLYRRTVRLLSLCIEHLHDTNLSPEEQKARELAVHYAYLLVQRWDNPLFGKDEKTES